MPRSGFGPRIGWSGMSVERWQIRKRRASRGVDMIALLGAGLLGCLMAGLLGLVLLALPDRRPAQAWAAAEAPAAAGMVRPSEERWIEGAEMVPASAQPAPLTAGREAAAAPAGGARFEVDASDLLGYAHGLGLDHTAYGLLAGTYCRLDLRLGAMVEWYRERAGGADCKLVLFDKGVLRPGWRIEWVQVQLGFGTGIAHASEDAVSSQNGRGAGSGTIWIRPGQQSVPVLLSLRGWVPLAGARHTAELHRFVVAGPANAADWRGMFEGAARTR